MDHNDSLIEELQRGGEVKQDQLTKDAVLLDPAGDEHIIDSIDTTTGTDHSGWRYILTVGKRKMKPLSYQVINGFFTLKPKN